MTLDLSHVVDAVLILGVQEVTAYYLLPTMFSWPRSSPQ